MTKQLSQQEKAAQHAMLTEKYGTLEALRAKAITIYTLKHAYPTEREPTVRWSYGADKDSPAHEAYRAYLLSEGREPNLLDFETCGASAQEAMFELVKMVKLGQEKYDKQQADRKKEDEDKVLVRKRGVVKYTGGVVDG